MAEEMGSQLAEIGGRLQDLLVSSGKLDTFMPFPNGQTFREFIEKRGVSPEDFPNLPPEEVGRCLYDCFTSFMQSMQKKPSSEKPRIPEAKRPDPNESMCEMFEQSGFLAPIVVYDQSGMAESLRKSAEFEEVTTDQLDAIAAWPQDDKIVICIDLFPKHNGSTWEAFGVAKRNLPTGEAEPLDCYYRRHLDKPNSDQMFGDLVRFLERIAVKAESPLGEKVRAGEVVALNRDDYDNWQPRLESLGIRCSLDRDEEMSGLLTSFHDQMEETRKSQDVIDSELTVDDILALPQEFNLVYDVAIGKINTWVFSGGRYGRPTKLCIYNRNEDTPVAIRSLHESSTPKKYIEAFLTSVKSPIGSGEGVRPKTIYVDDRDVFNILSHTCEAIGVELEMIDYESPGRKYIDAICNDGSEEEKRDGPHLTYIPDISDEQLERFYILADRFYRYEPWKTFSPLEVFQIDMRWTEDGSTRESTRYAIIVGGEHAGMYVYPDIDPYKAHMRFLTSKSSDRGESHWCYTALMYGRRHQIPFSEFDKIEKELYPISEESAYPALGFYSYCSGVTPDSESLRPIPPTLYQAKSMTVLMDAFTSLMETMRAEGDTQQHDDTPDASLDPAEAYPWISETPGLQVRLSIRLLDEDAEALPKPS